MNPTVQELEGELQSILLVENEFEGHEKFLPGSVFAILEIKRLLCIERNK